MFNVEKVIIRIINNDLRPIYESMGIETICPAELSANAVLDFYYGGHSHE